MLLGVALTPPAAELFMLTACSLLSVPSPFRATAARMIHRRRWQVLGWNNVQELRGTARQHLRGVHEINMHSPASAAATAARGAALPAVPQD